MTDIYDRTIAHYGADAQYYKVIEECAELTLSIMHHRLGRVSVSKVCEELADVEITLRSLRRVLGESICEDALEAKLGRLEHRLDRFAAEAVDLLVKLDPPPRTCPECGHIPHVLRCPLAVRR